MDFSCSLCTPFWVCLFFSLLENIHFFKIFDRFLDPNNIFLTSHSEYYLCTSLPTHGLEKFECHVQWDFLTWLCHEIVVSFEKLKRKGHFGLCWYHLNKTLFKFTTCYSGTKLTFFNFCYTSLLYRTLKKTHVSHVNAPMLFRPHNDWIYSTHKSRCVLLAKLAARNTKRRFTKICLYHWKQFFTSMKYFWMLVTIFWRKRR